MNIYLLKPKLQEPFIASRVNQIRYLLTGLGHDIVEHACGPTLYESVRKDQPDVVLNLASVYGAEKSDLVPAVLEIADVPYTGSGMLGLSLSRCYTRLLPMLAKAGVRTAPFRIIEAGSGVPHGVLYPLYCYRDGEPRGVLAANDEELNAFLKSLPAQEEVVLQEHPEGKRAHVYALDGAPFLVPAKEAYLEIVQKTCQLLEVRGLSRFDFFAGPSPVLEAIDLAPDPLGEGLIRLAASAGWNESRLLQALVEHAGRDHSA